MQAARQETAAVVVVQFAQRATTAKVAARRTGGRAAGDGRKVGVVWLPRRRPYLRKAVRVLWIATGSRYQCETGQCASKATF